jgi:hypothetical protein
MAFIVLNNYSPTSNRFVRLRLVYLSDFVEFLSFFLRFALLEVVRLC